MSKLFIVSRKKLINTELIFKGSIILEGYVDKIAPMREEYAYLCDLISFNNYSSYSHILVLKKKDQKLINWLLLQESDFYVFEATRYQLITLRRVYRELKSGEKIFNLMAKLRFSDLSIITSKAGDQRESYKLSIHKLTCDLFDFYMREYLSSFTEQIIMTRNSFVTYYSTNN